MAAGSPASGTFLKGPSAVNNDKQSALRIFLGSMLHDQAAEEKVWIPRFQLRMTVIQEWAIGLGKRVLDIGCGQGESSAILALALGPESRIVAIDPARSDYGIPYTVSQSQEYICRSAIGSQISFFQTTAADLFKSLNQSASAIVDVATLCHSLWYFPDIQTVIDLFRTLADAGITKVYTAEYDFDSAMPSQQPHMLAARAQASLYASRALREPGTRTLNVRGAPDKKAILDAAMLSGFSAVRQGTVTPEVNFLEGHFEAKYTMSDKFVDRVKLIHGVS